MPTCPSLLHQAAPLPLVLGVPLELCGYGCAGWCMLCRYVIRCNQACRQCTWTWRLNSFSLLVWKEGGMRPPGGQSEIEVGLRCRKKGTRLPSPTQAPSYSLEDG
eukprot:1145050-Pelagomonas_calceolata.AAC.4